MVAFFLTFTCDSLIITMLYNSVIIRSNDMPPKKQISTEQMIERAFHIVRSEGLDALTVRRLAKDLNCSTQPIYHTFSDMKELKKELMKRAQEEMVRFIFTHNEKELPIGLASLLSYVAFSCVEKNLFRMIFTTGDISSTGNSDFVPKELGIDLNMIVYVNGIIMMLAFQALRKSPEQIREMIINAYYLFQKNR